MGREVVERHPRLEDVFVFLEALSPVEVNVGHVDHVPAEDVPHYHQALVKLLREENLHASVTSGDRECSQLHRKV